MNNYLAHCFYVSYFSLQAIYWQISRPNLGQAIIYKSKILKKSLLLMPYCTIFFFLNSVSILFTCYCEATINMCFGRNLDQQSPCLNTELLQNPSTSAMFGGKSMSNNSCTVQNRDGQLRYSEEGQIFFSFIPEPLNIKL